MSITPLKKTFKFGLFSWLFYFWKKPPRAWVFFLSFWLEFYTWILVFSTTGVKTKSLQMVKFATDGLWPYTWHPVRTDIKHSIMPFFARAALSSEARLTSRILLSTATPSTMTGSSVDFFPVRARRICWYWLMMTVMSTCRSSVGVACRSCRHNQVWLQSLFTFHSSLIDTPTLANFYLV